MILFFLDIAPQSIVFFFMLPYSFTLRSPLQSFVALLHSFLTAPVCCMPFHRKTFALFCFNTLMTNAAVEGTTLNLPEVSHLFPTRPYHKWRNNRPLASGKLGPFFDEVKSAGPISHDMADPKADAIATIPIWSAAL